MKTTFESIKNNIQKLKPYLVSNYSISELFIFGSYVRNEQTVNSDIDILVEFKKIPDLLTFIEIEDYLSSKLNHKIDLVPKRKLKAQLKRQILNEAIAI